MSEIKIKIEPITVEALEQLESKGLIKMFRPPQKIAEHPHQDAVEVMYVSAPECGHHQLLCVRKNVTKIRFEDHDENEEVIFVNPAADNFKPLYLVIGLGTTDVLLSKAKNEDVVVAPW